MSSSSEITRIVVTSPDYQKAKDVFVAAAADGLECISAADDEASLAQAVRAHNARHVIIGVAPYSGPLYDALPKNGVIARFGVGHDSIDKELATRKGLFCTNTPGVLADSVAEYTLALILAAARHIPRATTAAKKGQWAPLVGKELKGKKLAVIGCGPIGSRVARTAAFGFALNVVGCEITDVDVETMKKDLGLADLTKDFAEAVADADYVSIHIPSNSSTQHFLNHQRLSQMAERAWLINTSRGSVIDEAALFDSLMQGRLAGAALDVFEHEPYQPVTPDKDLRQLDQVIMTPHLGSSTQEACDRMALRALHNIKLAHAGRIDEMDLVNPAVRTR